MRIPRLGVFAFLSLATLCVPAFGANAARPGAVNYIEGSASLAGEPLTSKSVGSAEMNPGEVLSTGNGKAEILMTPGVYLRLDDQSSVKMISPDLTFTQLSLERGRAAVEVDEIYPQNSLQIVESGVPTQMLKTGFYEFNAKDGMARVFKGKAATRMPDGKWVVIKAHHELALNAGDALKPRKFNVKTAEDEFYNWNSLRSQYLSEANAQLSQQYGYGYGFASGWYWNPYSLGYTFMGPYPFYSPFGWGFYPFGYMGYGPAYNGGFGFHGHGFHGHHRIGGRHPIGHGFRGGDFRSGQRSPLSHGPASSFHGGMHSSFSGGFHGGGHR